MRFSKGHLRLSHREIWNAGEHIAACIYNGLLQFKNSERLGCPADLTSIEWNEYLDKMLFSFKEISTHYKNDPYEIYFRENLKKEFNNFEVDDNGRLLEKVKIPDLDAVDDPCNTERTEIEKKSKEYFDKIKEGLSLFSKYYMDLWD